MLNFNLHTTTEIVFGKDIEEQIGPRLKELGAHRILVHFGGSSARTSGLLDRVEKSLFAAGLAFVELGGVSPNPKVSLVRKGIALAEREGIDFVLAVGGNLNGPTIGGIFTIVGFSATGKHLRNIFPFMAGVCIASTVRAWDITNPSALLALLFSTTLAPIAGEFGILCGVLAGFLHASVALNVGIVYGGMNLYNNGFAGGIVAMFLVPVIQSIRDRRARAKGDLSL